MRSAKSRRSGWDYRGIHDVRAYFHPRSAAGGTESREHGAVVARDPRAISPTFLGKILAEKLTCYLGAGTKRPRKMYSSALTASSIKRNGLAIKSLPPLMVELARLSKSVSPVTKTTGVFLCIGMARSLVHSSK